MEQQQSGPGCWEPGCWDDMLQALSSRGEPVVMMVSMKDLRTTRQMVEAIIRWINRDYTGLIKAKNVWAKGPSVSETLWETALKLRQHRSEADEALASGILDALDHFLSAPAWLMDPPQKNFVLRVSANVDSPCDVRAYLHTAQLSCSVLMELCRYRRGCLAVAESPVSSRLLLRGYMTYTLNLASVFVIAAFEASGTGFEEHPLQWSTRLMQANLDVIGRCLSRMPPGVTRARAGRQVMEWLDDEKIEAWVNTTSKSADGCCAMGIVDRPTWSTGPVDKLKAAVAQLTTLADACQEGRCYPPFKVHYVMEAGILEGVLPKGMVEHITARDCVWCGTIGRTRRCSRCRNAWYCSTTCQTEDWKDGHKDDCTALQVDSTLADIRQVVRAARQTEDNADRTVGIDQDAQTEASASAAQIAFQCPQQAAMGVAAGNSAPQEIKSKRRRHKKKSRKAGRDAKATRAEAPSGDAAGGGVCVQLPLEKSACAIRDDHAAFHAVDEDVDPCAICLDPFSPSEPRQASRRARTVSTTCACASGERPVKRRVGVGGARSAGRASDA